MENLLAERDKEGKPKHQLAELLREPAKEGEEQPDDPSHFRSMAGLVTRKVAINPDGTW